MILTALVPGPRELPRAPRGTGIAISLMGGNFRFLIASLRNVLMVMCINWRAVRPIYRVWGKYWP